MPASSTPSEVREELLPCPFCGGVIINPAAVSPSGDEHQPHFGAVCVTCIAEGPLATNAQEANRRWNTRAPTPLDAGERARELLAAQHVAALKSALRFAASRSAITSSDEQAILAALARPSPDREQLAREAENTDSLQEMVRLRIIRAQGAADHEEANRHLCIALELLSALPPPSPAPDAPAWQLALDAMEAECRTLREALQQAKLQLEYLDEKFERTGTTAGVLAQIDYALQQAEGQR